MVFNPLNKLEECWFLNLRVVGLSLLVVFPHLQFSVDELFTLYDKIL